MVPSISLVTSPLHSLSTVPHHSSHFTFILANMQDIYFTTKNGKKIYVPRLAPSTPEDVRLVRARFQGETVAVPLEAPPFDAPSAIEAYLPTAHDHGPIIWAVLATLAAVALVQLGWRSWSRA